MASSGNAWGEETNLAWRKSLAWGPFDVPPSHSAFEQRSAEEEEPAAPREDPAFEVRPETAYYYPGYSQNRRENFYPYRFGSAERRAYAEPSDAYDEPSATYAEPGAGPDPTQPKSRSVAGTLAVVLGAFGAHRFYLGYTNQGLIMLLVSMFAFPLGLIWGLIEAVGIFNRTGITEDANGIPLVD